MTRPMLDVARDILTEVRSLAPFPEVALRVMQLAGRQDVMPAELVAVIQTDPGLTAKVLKLCNSAYYSFQRKIATLQEAGNMLGVATVVNLVLTSCTSRYFHDYGQAGAAGETTQWERTVANALAARILASLRHEIDVERAYTGGLLQNIGHIVLNRFLQRERIAIHAEIGRGATLIEAERSVLGLDHAEIGARLATRWNFPEVLVDSIRYHHRPERAAVDPPLTAVMHLAESLCWSIGFGEGLDGVGYGVLANVVQSSGLKAANLEGMKRMLRQEMQLAQELVATS